MFDRRLRVPLSPPTSPRMSDSARRAEHHSQHAKPHAHSGYHSYRELEEGGGGHLEGVGADSQDPTDRSHRPYESFAYSARPSGTSCQQHSAHSYHQNVSGESQQPESGLHSTGSKEFRSTTYGVSSPSSPVDRLTPQSPDMSVQGQQDDDDLIDSAGEGQDEGTEKIQMTAAELRAHKRKMKRFRLTHSQTRFLMSEFARQAHPDAGHRERLAREIPGLSARQVQVWFQNRRAKLKRHTTDDQARMMRSRALPDDFDTTQALHSPFGAQQPQMGVSSSSVGSYPMYNEHGGVRPLTLDTVRGVAEYAQYSPSYASPSGVSPALGAFAFTPPRSVSDHISPGPSNSMSPYVVQHQAAYDSSRRAPICLPAIEHGYPPVHPSQQGPPSDQMSRMPIDPTSFQLRGSESYAEGSTSVLSHPFAARSPSYTDHLSYDHQRLHPPRSAGMMDSDSHGSTFSHPTSHTYPTSESQHRTMPGQHGINPENFRRVAPGLSYSQYPPASYTSAPFQNYTQPYSRDIHGNHPQEVHAEPFGHAQRDHNQLHDVSGTHQHFAQTAGNQVTETSGNTYGVIPPSY